MLGPGPPSCPSWGHERDLPGDTSPGNDAVAQAARRLLRAAADHVPCPPVRDLIGSDDVKAAYAVQELLTAHRLEAGGRVTGRKIGLTSPAVQRQLGVDQPDFGVLFADMSVEDGASVPVGGLLQPKVEAEIAFVLGADLADGPLDDAQIRAAVAHAVPALEIVDSRIADWDITFGDTVADNGSSALYVIGGPAKLLTDFEPVEADMTMKRHEETVSASTTARPAWAIRSPHSAGSPGPRATSATRCAPTRSCCPARSARWCPPRPATCSPPTSADSAPCPSTSTPPPPATKEPEA